MSSIASSDTESSLDIAELCDHLDWIVELIRMRTGPTDADRTAALPALVAAQASIATRLSELTAQRALQKRLSLSDTEMQVIWILVATCLDDRAKHLLLGASGMEPALSLESLRRVVYGRRPSGQAVRELGQEGTLRRLNLIERSDGAGNDSHESRWSWTVSRRILAWLHGDRASNSEIARLADPMTSRPLEELIVPPRVVEQLRSAIVGDCCILITGQPGLGRRSIAAAVANAEGKEVLVVEARRLASDASLVLQCRDILRECLLLERAPLLVGIEVLGAEAVDTIGRELVGAIPGPVLATSGLEHAVLSWPKPIVAIELEPPTSAQRARLWLEALGQGTAEDGELLANQYPLAPAVIRAAAEAAQARGPCGRTLRPDDIAAGVRSCLDARLGQLARRMEVTQTWDDLVLADDQLAPILELIARVHERRKVYEQWGFAAKVGKGLGTTALFSGPPGTGKTMVAALIARDLGIELYQVDLSRVVSKWVGETEKQLSSIFDGAEAGHAILLFDEADALFGKRTDVKSSNDRYANLETNYLLQRLESFTGICLLTSNHESSIDPAFHRRLSLHVRFQLPEVREREQLWRATIPGEAPLAGDVDFASLARRYTMSGGYIRNASLRAAFLAASDNVAISAAHLEVAARIEYEAMGKIVM